MLLKEIPALRAGITITFAKKPAEESVYVGDLVLNKDGHRIQFDWTEQSETYNENTLYIETKDLDTLNAAENTTFEDLKGAVVDHLFLQGEDSAYVEGQEITDIELCLFGAADDRLRMMFHKDAFTDTDLGEYYAIRKER